LDIPVGEATSHVRVCVRGKVRVVSEQRDLELEASGATQLATMHDTLKTEAMYLANTNAGWVLYALGKTGEPRGQRPLTVTLVHRWAHTQLTVELATDADGRCELGELAGIERITATLGASSQTWWLGDDAQVPSTLHAA